MKKYILLISFFVLPTLLIANQSATYYLMNLKQQYSELQAINKKFKTKNIELKKIRDKLKRKIKGFGIATGILAGTTATTFVAGTSAKNKEKQVKEKIIKIKKTFSKAELDKLREKNAELEAELIKTKQELKDAKAEADEEIKELSEKLETAKGEDEKELEAAKKLAEDMRSKAEVAEKKANELEKKNTEFEKAKKEGASTEEIKKLKEEKQKIAEELQIAKNDLEKKQKELEKAKENLDKNNQELSKTKRELKDAKAEADEEIKELSEKLETAKGEDEKELEAAKKLAEDMKAKVEEAEEKVTELEELNNKLEEEKSKGNNADVETIQRLKEEKLELKEELQTAKDDLENKQEELEKAKKDSNENSDEKESEANNKQNLINEFLTIPTLSSLKYTELSLKNLSLEELQDLQNFHNSVKQAVNMENFKYKFDWELEGDVKNGARGIITKKAQNSGLKRYAIYCNKEISMMESCSNTNYTFKKEGNCWVPYLSETKIEIRKYDANLVCLREDLGNGQYKTMDDDFIYFGKNTIIEEVYRITQFDYYIIKKNGKYNFYYNATLLKSDLKYPMSHQVNPYQMVSNNQINTVVIRENVIFDKRSAPISGDYHFFIKGIYLNKAFPVFLGKRITAWSNNSPYKTINVTFSDGSVLNNVSLPNFPKVGKYEVDGNMKNMN